MQKCHQPIGLLRTFTITCNYSEKSLRTTESQLFLGEFFDSDSDNRTDTDMRPVL